MLHCHGWLNASTPYDQLHRRTHQHWNKCCSVRQYVCTCLFNYCYMHAHSYVAAVIPVTQTMVHCTPLHANARPRQWHAAYSLASPSIACSATPHNTTYITYIQDSTARQCNTRHYKTSAKHTTIKRSNRIPLQNTAPASIHGRSFAVPKRRKPRYLPSYEPNVPPNKMMWMIEIEHALYWKR